ncbi:MAG: DUF5591 domain-containing protein [Euryarchaeota archaeon]|nr:DUF5591 domain-containing protein [Euryarchaeota archaeon]
MLEVADRAGLARIVNWTINGSKALLPNILFHSSEIFSSPPYAEMLISPTESHLNVIMDEEVLFEIEDDINPPLSYQRRRSIEDIDRSIIIRDKIGKSSSQSGELFVLNNAFELRRDARKFVESVKLLREYIGYNKLIYAPGIMEPSNISLLIYMGIDLFDSSQLIYQGSRGRILLPEGVFNASDSEKYPTSQDIIRHNLDAAWKELKLARYMIRIGRLRELVESRAHSTPWGVAALRLLDHDYYDYQEKYTPVVGPSFYANTKMALLRPDVRRFRQRILERWAPAAHKKILLLIPCSAKKPYYTSKSHRILKEVLLSVPNSCSVQELIITSPLGAVPRELELFYPAAQYDIPVTGHWDCEERSIVKELITHAASFDFNKVINHLGDDGKLTSGVVNSIYTADGGSTSNDSLESLREALLSACGEVDKVPRAHDRIEMLRSVARYQFGSEAGILLDDATVVGKYPYVKIMEGKTQRAMLTPDRGMLSLTLDGAEKLLNHGIGWVEMGDFDLVGSLFSVGVQAADPTIRPGDEVVLLRNNEIEGVGVAIMSGAEMADSQRGEAVKVRHKRRRK